MWQKISEIPYGETRTYGDLARELGKENDYEYVLSKRKSKISKKEMIKLSEKQMEKIREIHKQASEGIGKAYIDLFMKNLVGPYSTHQPSI